MPQTEHPFIAKRLRTAGLLIGTGLLVEGLSLFWNHPLSFIAFLAIGGLLIFVGIVIYLASLVSPRPPG
jgi:hypothetical protein